MKAFLDRFSIWVCLNLMYYNVGVNTRHFFIAPGEDVTKFFEKLLVGDDLVRGIFDMHIFDNSRFDGYVEGNSG
jgi:hypothetical protein